MEGEVRPRNRLRRERAQRMRRDRPNFAKERPNLDSGEDDEPLNKVRPPRPIPKKKRSKDPLYEEDIVDGFAIISFKSYDDLQVT